VSVFGTVRGGDDGEVLAGTVGLGVFAGAARL
jgi:hypothetical protein